MRQRRRSEAVLALVCAVMMVGTAFPAVGETLPYSLVVSSSADRSASAPLDGAQLTGNAYVLTSPDTADISVVRFWLDNPGHTGAPRRSESTPPYDFNGGTVSSATPFNFSSLAAGRHSITAEIVLKTGPSQFLTASFTVGAVAPPVAVTDQVHLSWTENPALSFTATWRTGFTSTASEVEYRLSGATTWQTATGTQQASGTAGTLHRVAVTGLTADSEYQYRVRGDEGTWSPVFTTRTAPTSGAFDFVYVADTGIIGRTDGLTAGTRAVIDSIVGVDPDLLLVGGDYAYFNTDIRFPTLDTAIDAWFNQMQPLASRAPMMPTYGNHEVLLGEGFDPWADRFATPTGAVGPTAAGVDARGNYSFDVGSAHFVSITAVYETSALAQSQVDWITQDVTAARQRGATWIIPFFHAAPFSEGMNHPSNRALRQQIGPLLEQLDIPLAMYSHDQSYERTYPLVKASSTVSSTTNKPTSTSLTCYTQGDGVVWLKTSPGGKLSNKSQNFSPWRTASAPAWTAVRDNTRHHYTRVTVDDSSLRVVTYGLTDTGSTTVQDDFTITTGMCATPPPPPPPPPGTYSLLVSASPNRSAPTPLEGAALTGNAYVFTSPDTPDISAVRFWVDNPGHTGVPRRTETGAPYDFNGGTVSTATAFNVSTLAPGAHSVTVEIVLKTGGSQFHTSTFTVS